MANIKIREADSTISDTLASGSGSPGDPKIPRMCIHDPVTGLELHLQQTDFGEVVLPVHAANVHSRPFFTHFARSLGDLTTLTVAAVAGDYQITVANGALFVAGNKIQLRTTANREPDYLRITAVAGNLLTLDRRIDYPYPIGAEVEKFSVDANVSGSLASPVSFRYYPRPGKQQHAESFVFYISSSLQPYDSYFGGIAALPNGIHLRKYNGADGTYQTLFSGPFRSNRRFKQNHFDVEYGDRASPSDAYSTTASIRTVEVVSSMFRLDAAVGDYLEMLIQDNLTSLAGFEMQVHGHEEIPHPS